jgi:hypothetical protein
MQNDNQNQPHEKKKKPWPLPGYHSHTYCDNCYWHYPFFILKRGSSSGTNTTNSSSNSSSENLISCSNVKGTKCQGDDFFDNLLYCKT